MVLSPLHTSHIAHSQPSFINIEEHVALLPHLDEFEGPLLPKNEVLIRVRVERRFQYLSVTHPHFLGHHSPDKVAFDVDAYLVLDFPLDALSRIDDGILLDHIRHNLLYHVDLQRSVFLSPKKLVEVVSVLEHAYKSRDHLGSDAHLFGNVFSQLVLHEDFVNDQHFVVTRERLPPPTSFS